MKKNKQSILDIINSINLILDYSQDLDWLEIQSKEQDAIILRFIIMGEATKRLSQDFRERYPEFPWKQMAGLRDVIVHEYDDINLDVIRDVIEMELPSLLPQLREIYDNEFSNI